MEVTHAYSLDSIHEMLKVLPEPSRTAYLRRLLQGCASRRFVAYVGKILPGDELTVRRAVWASHIRRNKDDGQCGCCSGDFRSCKASKPTTNEA